MTTKLKVLIVEDRAADAELALHELRRAGYDPEWARVETEPEFLAQLARGWEIVLADHKLPAFSGMRALELLREREPDLPFILVSGTIGEDNAVANMKAGANDYVMKDRLARLGPAVGRELREAHGRRERKHAVRALEESEERFRQLADMLPQIVFEADPQGTLTFANRHGLKSLGYSLKDFEAGLNLVKMVAPKDRDTIRQRVGEILAGSDAEAHEYQLARKDGKTFPVLIHATAIFKDGAPVGLRGIGIDITERKREEEELRKSEERFRILFEYAPDAHYLSDAKGTFIDGNKSAEALSGYDKKELIGKNFLKLNLLSPGQILKAAKLLLNSVLGKQTGPDEFVLRRKSGETVNVEISSYPMKLDGKSVVLGIARDITERQRTQEALRNAEKNFRLSLDESPLGIRIVSAEGETIYANQAILDFFGYADVRELNQTPLRDRYTPESYADFRGRDRQRKNGEPPPSEYEISIVRKTGEIRRLRVFRKEIVWDGQKRFQSVYQDVTERRKAEASLQETLLGLRKALGGIIQVLASVSEIRDPYTAGHQRRVADLARAIGQELGLPPDRVEGIRVAGLIHDIGKMSIPAEILSKPALLSKIEYALIQSHAQIGHDILSEIEFAWPIAKIILQHHERMDGSGYPQKLKGDDILLESRILAVSDVIEAMASHRPYRPSMGIEAALKEIENNRGVLYDPAVVSACLALFREKGFKLAD
jgi:PAS domain S-box-containing protein/putative nucleotidyltransferase with HDIG domain